MIYIATRYSDPSPEVEQARYQMAADFTAHLMHKGFVVFSPIVYGHSLARAKALPTDAEWWKEFNYQMLDSCVAIAVLMSPGWTKSKGVQMEMKWALDLSMSIFYYDMEFNLDHFEERDRWQQ